MWVQRYGIYNLQGLQSTSTSKHCDCLLPITPQYCSHCSLHLIAQAAGCLIQQGRYISFLAFADSEGFTSQGWTQHLIAILFKSSQDPGTLQQFSFTLYVVHTVNALMRLDSRTRSFLFMILFWHPSIETWPKSIIVCVLVCIWHGFIKNTTQSCIDLEKHIPVQSIGPGYLVHIFPN